MGNQREMTLEELLHDPIILTLMQRDGCSPEDIRLLARQARAKMHGVEDVLWAAAGSQWTPPRNGGSAHAVPYLACQSNCQTPLAM